VGPKRVRREIVVTVSFDPKPGRCQGRCEVFTQLLVASAHINRAPPFAAVNPQHDTALLRQPQCLALIETMARDVKGFVLAPRFEALETIQVVRLPSDKHSNLAGTGLDSTAMRGDDEHLRWPQTAPDSVGAGGLGTLQLREVGVLVMFVHIN